VKNRTVGKTQEIGNAHHMKPTAERGTGNGLGIPFNHRPPYINRGPS
jgi:hypothetical protein